MSAAADGAQSWPQIADWYDRLLAGGSPQHELAVVTTLRLAGDIRGARVLDLACGQGMAARALAKAGAVAVTGVDATAEMIAAFWRRAVRRAGTYHRTLSSYLNALLASGFALEAVEEPTASDALAAQQPVYAGVPIFFAGRAVRR